MRLRVHVLVLLLTSLAASSIVAPGQAHGMLQQLFLVTLTTISGGKCS